MRHHRAYAEYQRLMGAQKAGHWIWSTYHDKRVRIDYFIDRRHLPLIVSFADLPHTQWGMDTRDLRVLSPLEMLARSDPSRDAFESNENGTHDGTHSEAERK